MASDKKKNYSTEGLNSRQEVQDALASAGYQPSERVTEAEAALKAQQSAAPGNYQSRYQDQIDRTLNDLNARRAFHYNYAQDRCTSSMRRRTPRTPTTPAPMLPHRPLR